MDIQYLLWLQEFRISINDSLTPFMEGVSDFAISYLYLVPAIVYWCIKKRGGLYLMASFCVSMVINGVVKLTACVYRPWIRDARIIPAGDAIKSTGGYSFPSGHTMTAAPILGGLSVLLKKRGKTLACVLCAAMILLVMFSRNYLGVHTPQDVVVGLILGVLAVWIVSMVFRYLDAHPEKEDVFLLLGFLAGAASLAYITLKSYPMDYIDGKLIVNPESMKASSISDISMIFGLVLGRWIDKRWLKFRPAGLGVMSIILCAAGCASYLFVLGFMKSHVIPVLGMFCGRVLYGSMKMFYIVALWPAVIKIFCRNK